MNSNEITMHLWAGYTDGFDAGINAITYVAGFVPYVEITSQALEDQLLAGRDDWDKVFAYDVVQEAGAWLKAQGLTTTPKAFKAELARLIN
jgi:hypothetical protein